MVHTKIKILEALKTLTDNYDSIIQNPGYRGSMDKYAFFTVKTIAKEIQMTPNTVRRWCHILNEEGLIFLRWKRCYSANDSMTMEFRRKDAEIIHLRFINAQERREQEIKWEAFLKCK